MATTLIDKHDPSAVSNARGWWSSIQEMVAAHEAAAHKVKNLYLRHRIGIGRIDVKHGAYLDRDVIRRAVAM